LHVLDVLAACDFDGLLVATDGDDVASLAASRGASALRDEGVSSLAAVVDASLAYVASRGADAAVVLMADLPRIEPVDVGGLLEPLDDHDVVLVRDHIGNHTNALAVAPPTAIATCFGRDDSFAAHLAAASAAGLRAAVVTSERIAFDVDVPADHRKLMARRRATGT
jgi:2-phospho-L-lactate guanylyltransferase